LRQDAANSDPALIDPLCPWTLGVAIWLAHGGSHGQGRLRRSRKTRSFRRYGDAL